MPAAVSRFSTYAQHQKMMGLVSTAQSNMGDLQIQISSGKKSENYSGFSGQVELVGTLENKMRAANQYVESNTILESRLRTMSVSVQKMLEIASDTRKLITLSRSTYITEGAVLRPQARALLKDVADQLNTNIGGRFLFAGSRTDTQPVPEDIPASDTPGVPDDGYYYGDNVKLASRINDSFSVEYGVTANEEGFQNLIAAINELSRGLEYQDDDMLENAINLINDALEGINSVQSSINNNIINVTRASEQHESLKLYWKGIVSQSTDTDIVAASTQLQMDNAVLQATYQAFAKISALRLADYL